MAKKKIKPTKKQMAMLKAYWSQLMDDQAVFHSLARNMEKLMSRDVGIKGLEFIKVDGDYVGIGNSKRTMELLQGEDLE
jgi:hypothetical protein